MAGAFLLVRCHACENEQTLFEKSATVVSCTECEEPLAEPTGGKARIHGDVADVIDAR